MKLRRISTLCLLLLCFSGQAQTYPRIGYAGLLITNVVGAISVGGGGGGGGGTFTPSPGYLSYWTADDITGADGSSVTTWIDEGIANTLTGSGGVLKKSFVNGKNAVDLTSSGRYTTTIPTANITWPLTVIAVAKCDSLTGGAETLWGSYNGTMFLGIRTDFDMLRFGWQSDVSNVGVGSGLLSTTNWVVLTLQCPSSGNMTIYTNLVPIITNSTFFAGSSGESGFQIGSTANPWSGKIASVIIYTNAMSYAVISNNIYGLKVRYGIN